MRARRATIWVLATLVAVAINIGASSGESSAPRSIGTMLGGEPPPGFARAEQPRAFVFPADHGPHLGFRSEWWYLSGNLDDDAGHRFGYELTIFRFALAPMVKESASEWSTNQVYLAHFAVTDTQQERFRFDERLARGAVGLAGAQSSPFRVWVEDWQLRGPEDGEFPWRLQARNTELALKLTLEPLKPVVLNGDRGLSQKGPRPGNASYYYSIPRLATGGVLRVQDTSYPVHGTSWLDREWSTSALGTDQVGWDWFALQFEDGYDLMYYQLRRSDGSTDPHSAGALIDPQGRRHPLGPADVVVTVLRHWRNDRGDRYPAQWRLSVPRHELVAEVSPLMADQELRLSPRYWEGAVEATATRAGTSVNGVGYVELTGYASATD